MGSYLDTINTQPVEAQEKPKSYLDLINNPEPNREVQQLNYDKEIDKLPVFLNTSDKYTLNPAQYQKTFQTDFQAGLSQFLQGIDQTQKSVSVYELNNAQYTINKNIDNRKEAAAKLGVNSSEYQQYLQQLDQEDADAQKKIEEYQSDINNQNKQVANNPTDEIYLLKEAVTQAQGGDAKLWDSIKYTMPNMMGSSVSLMGQTLAATFGTGLIKSIVKNTGASMVLGPEAAPFVAGGTALLSGLSMISYGANLETKAEIGGQIEQAQQILLDKYMETNHLVDESQVPEEIKRQIQMQSMKGTENLYWEQMAGLTTLNTLTALIAPLSTLGKGFNVLGKVGTAIEDVTQFNKYTRAATTLGKTYVDYLGEKQEEGFQYASEKRQLDGVLGIGDYTNKKFIQNLGEDYWDSASSLAYIPGVNLRPGGKYANDMQFQFSEDAGGLLGAMTGFVSGGINIVKDINKYKATNKELQNKGVINIDDKVFRFKDQIYAKNFENNTLHFLLEGVRNLTVAKDEKGLPYLTKQQADSEIKNITTAFDNYTKVKEHLDNLPLDKYLYNSKEQKQKLNQLKSDLFQTVQQVVRHQDTLNKLNLEKEALKVNNLSDLSSFQINDLTDLIEKNNQLIDNVEKSGLVTPGISKRLDFIRDNVKNLIKAKDLLLKENKENGIKIIEQPLTIDQSNKNAEIVKTSQFLKESELNYQGLLKVKTNKDLEKYFKDIETENKEVADKHESLLKETDESLKQLPEELVNDNIISKNSTLHPLLALQLAKIGKLSTTNSDKLKGLDRREFPIHVISQELLKFISPSTNPNTTTQQVANEIINHLLKTAKSAGEIQGDLTDIQFFSFINNKTDLSPELQKELETWKAEEADRQAKAEQERLANIKKNNEERKVTALSKINEINTNQKEFSFNGQGIYTSIEVLSDSLETSLPVKLKAKTGEDLQIDLLAKTGHYNNYSLLFPVNTNGINQVIEVPTTNESFSSKLPDTDGYSAFTNGIGDDTIGINYNLANQIEFIRETKVNDSGSTFRVIKYDENGYPEPDFNHASAKINHEALSNFIKNLPSIDEVTVKIVENYFNDLTEDEKAKLKKVEDLYGKENITPLGIYDKDNNLLGYIPLPKESSFNKSTQILQDESREKLLALRKDILTKLKNNELVTLKVDKDKTNTGNPTYRLVRNLDTNNPNSIEEYDVFEKFKNIDFGIGAYNSNTNKFEVFHSNTDAKAIESNLQNIDATEHFHSDNPDELKSKNKLLFAYIRDLTGNFTPTDIFIPFLSKADSTQLTTTIMDMMRRGEGDRIIETEMNKLVFSTGKFDNTYHSVVVIQRAKDNNKYTLEFKRGYKTVRTLNITTQFLEMDKSSDRYQSEIAEISKELEKYRYNINFEEFRTSPEAYKGKLLTNLIQNSDLHPEYTGEYGKQFFSEAQVAYVDPLVDNTQKEVETSQLTASEILNQRVDDDWANNINNFGDDFKVEITPWTTQTEKENKESVDSWMKTNLPGLNESLLKDIYSFTNRGQAVFGVFRHMISIVGEDAPLGVRYHEAFHGVFQFLLNDKERNSVLSEAKEKYGKKLTDKQLEEKLADEFMDYKLMAFEPKGIKGWIKWLFDKLIQHITAWGLYGDKTQQVFAKINTGKYAKESLKYKLQPNVLSVEQSKILNDYYPDVEHKVIPFWSHERKQRSIPQMAQHIIQGIVKLKDISSIKGADGKVNITPKQIQGLFDEIAQNYSTGYQLYSSGKISAGLKQVVDSNVYYEKDGDTFKPKLQPNVREEIEKYLRIFNINIKNNTIEYSQITNDLLNDLDDVDAEGNETKDHNNTWMQINAINSTSFRVKMLLAGINRFDSKGKIVNDPIFKLVPLYENFIKIYNRVRREVQNIPDPKEIEQKLIELAKTDKQFEQILAKYNEQNIWVKSDFITSITNELHKDKRILIKKKGNSFERKIVVSNNTGSFFNDTKEWRFNHFELASPFSLFKEKDVPNTGKLNNFSKILLSKDNPFKQGTDADKIKNFLDKFGIIISEEGLNQMAIKINEGNENFLTHISKAIESIKSGKYQHYNEAIYFYAKFDQIYKDSLIASSYKNIKGDAVFAENRWTPLSKIWYNIIGKNKKDYIDNLVQTDPIYKYNNILTFLTSKPDSLTANLELLSMGGMTYDSFQNGRTFTDSHELDNLIQFITYFQNKGSDSRDNKEFGTFRNTVPADKTIQYMFTLPKYNTTLEKGRINFKSSEAIMDLYYKQIASEAERIIQFSNKDFRDKFSNNSIFFTPHKDIYGVSRNSCDQFHGISELNTKGILDEILKLNPSSPDFLDQIKGITELNSVLQDTLQKDVDSIMTILKDNNLDIVLGEPDLIQLITDYTLNSQINYLDLHTLFNGDLAQMPQAQKRSYGSGALLSTLNMTENIKVLGVTAGDIKLQRLLKYDVITVHHLREGMKGDLMASLNANPILKSLYESNPEIKKNKDEELESIIDSYYPRTRINKEGIVEFANSDKDSTETKVTDSIVYVSDKFMKKLQIANGKWDTSLQETYKKFGKTPTDKEHGANITVWKPFYHGTNYNDKNGKSRLDIIKSSVITLNENLVKGNPFLENMYKVLTNEDNKVDMIVTKDAFKGDIPNLHEINQFNVNSDFNPDNIIDLDPKFFGDQTDNPDHGLDTEGFGRLQLDATFASTIPEDIKIGDKDSDEVIRDINTLQAEHPQEGLNLLNRIKTTDLKAYNTLIKEETIKRGVTEAVENSLKINEDTGQFEMPFNFTTKSADLNYMIMSSYAKNSVRMGVSGGKLVQIPSIGFNGNTTRDYNEADIKQRLLDNGVSPENAEIALQKLIQLKKSLRNIRLENGQVEYAEALITATSSNFYKKDKNGTYTLKEISELSDNEKKQLEILGNRVPYEGLHSLMPMKVIGFLPAEYGSIIVLPYDVTTQMGSDFDLDSVYFRSYSTYKDEKGETQLYTYSKGKKTLDERYNQYIKWLTTKHPLGREVLKSLGLRLSENKLKGFEEDLETVETEIDTAEGLGINDETLRDLNINAEDIYAKIEKIEKFKENFPKLLIKELKAKGLIVNKKDFGDTNNPDAIANELLKNYMKTLKHPAMLYHMTRPSGFQELVDVHQDIMNYKSKSKNRFFSVAGQVDMEKTSHTGMILKAMAASNVTSHGRAIIMKLTSNNPLLVAFKPKEEVVPYKSLSNQYNKDGIFIADEIGAELAAIMDDLKKQRLADLNINSTTMQFLNIMIRKGIGLKNALYIINHPSMVEFAEKEALNTMMFKVDGKEQFNIFDRLAALNKEIYELGQKINEDKFIKMAESLGQSKNYKLYLQSIIYETKYNDKEKLAALDDKNLFYFKFNSFKILSEYLNSKKDSSELTLFNRANSAIKTLPGNIESAKITSDLINDLTNMLTPVIGENYGVIKTTSPDGYVIPYKSNITGDPSLYPVLYSAQNALDSAINTIFDNTSYRSDLYNDISNRIEAQIVKTNKSFLSNSENANLVKLRQAIKSYINQYILLNHSDFFSDVKTREQQKDFLLRNRNLTLRFLNLKQIEVVKRDPFFSLLDAKLSIENTDQDGLSVITTKFSGLDKASENEVTDSLDFWLDHNNILNLSKAKTPEEKENWPKIFEEVHQVAKDLIKYDLITTGWKYSPRSLTKIINPEFFENIGLMDQIKFVNNQLNSNNTIFDNNELKENIIRAFRSNKQHFDLFPALKLDAFAITDDITTLMTNSTNKQYVLGTNEQGIMFASAITVKVNQKELYLKTDDIEENGKIVGAIYKKGNPTGNRYYLENHLDNMETILNYTTLAADTDNEAVTDTQDMEFEEGGFQNVPDDTNFNEEGLQTVSDNNEMQPVDITTLSAFNQTPTQVVDINKKIEETKFDDDSNSNITPCSL